VDVVPEKRISAEKLMDLAALAESYSTHPIAGILRAGASGKDAGQLGQVTEVAGHGVLAEIDGEEVAVGNEKLMRSIGVAVPSLDGLGTKIYVARKKEYLGGIRISDEIKPESKKAIEELGKLGIRTVLLSGDSASSVKEVADAIGIEGSFAELLPEDKVSHVEKQIGQKDGSSSMVGFVGDGINDAPVLMRSDVGIAMGALGSDAAIEAADVVLMDDNLRKLPLAVRISQKCMRIVRENIVFSLLVKLLCLIFAAIGYANMWWAVFADVGVMVIAVLNATRMLRPLKIDD
jgi:Cd2+/Zn2+-exporting ATPase